MTSGNGPEPRKTVRGLGSLEAQLMEALWSTPTQLSVQEVCDKLGPDHNYKTVMTVLNRLVEKELLQRELDGRAYRYRPRQTREEFLEAVADELVQGYLSSYGGDAAKHLSAAVGAVAVPGTRPAPSPAASLHTNGAHPASAHSHRYEDFARISPLVFLLAVAVILQAVVLLRGRTGRKG